VRFGAIASPGEQRVASAGARPVGAWERLIGHGNSAVTTREALLGDEPLIEDRFRVEPAQEILGHLLVLTKPSRTAER
jgi:hypothetical protein